MRHRWQQFSLIFSVLAFGSLAEAATITVNSLSAAASDASACTLRAAITAANENASTNAGGCTAGSGADTIVFASALASQTITLTEQDNFWYGPNGLPPIYSDIAIDGGTAGITIARDPTAPKFRLFYIAGRLHPVPVGPKTNPPSPGTLTLRRLTLTGGLARGGHTTGGGGGAGMGGAIYNQGTLRIEQSALLANVAEGGSSLPGFGRGGGGIGGNASDWGVLSGNGGGFRDATASHGGDFLASEGGRTALSGTSAIGGNAGTLAGGGFQADSVGKVPSDGGGIGDEFGPSFCDETGSGYGAGAFGGGGGVASIEELCTGGGGVGGGGSHIYRSIAGLFAGSGGFGGGAGFLGVGGFGGGNSNVSNAIAMKGFAGGGGARALAGAFGGNGSTVRGESCGAGGGGLGGAVFNHFGNIVILNATLDGNRAQGGAGGSSTLSGEADAGGGGGAGLGGAVFNLNGVVRIESSTLSNNQAIGGLHGGQGDAADGQGVGGAVFNHFHADGVGTTIPAVTTTAAATRITLEDSILSDSVGNADCWNNTSSASSVILSGGNLIESNAAAANACGAPGLSGDPALGPLQNNGGPTNTRAPSPSSPVVNAASACPVPAVDQRGFTRPFDSSCDLGAVEARWSLVTISDVNQLEGIGGGSTAYVFTLTRTGNLAFPAEVVANTAVNTAGTNDFTAVVNQTVSFAANVSTTTVTVNVVADEVVEGDETFFVNVIAASGAVISDSHGIGTIGNDDSATLSIANRNRAEGNTNIPLVLTAGLSNPVQGTVSVNVSTVNGTATAPGDFTALNNLTLTFPDLTTTQTFNIAVVGDVVVEANENLTLTLGGLVAPAGVTLSAATPTMTLLNDDAAVLSIANLSQSEGNANNAPVLTASLSNPVQGPVSVNVSTVNGTATAPGDFTALNNQTLTFPDRTTTQNFNLSVVGESIVEADETLTLTLGGLVAPTGVTLSAATPSVTLQNDDSAVLSIANLSQSEGNANNAPVLTASLSNPVEGPVSVNVSTVDGTATAPGDFTALNNQTLTFPDRATTQNFNLSVVGESIVEADETLTLTLGGLVAPTGVTLSAATPSVTLQNDDSAVLSIAAVSQAEGNVSNPLALSASLSNPVDVPVSINVSTVDGSATGSADFTPISNQVLSFPALNTSQSVALSVSGDLVVETDETLSLALSNLQGPTAVSVAAAPVITLQNDDNAVLSFASISRPEGSGVNSAVLSASLSQPVDVPVTVNVSTVDGSALAGSDYTTITNQALTFPALNTSQTVNLAVLGDAVVEPDEDLSISLSGLLAPSAVTLGAAPTITLQNDDSGPLLTVSKQVTLLGPNFVTYTLLIENSGAAAQANNSGPEFVDVLPGALSLTGSSASSGVISVAGQTVNWDGSVPAGGTVTITLSANIDAPIGSTIVNQASVNYDANNDGSNESSALSDNPATGAPLDATVIGVAGPIPTLSVLGLCLLALVMVLLGARGVVVRGVY